MTEQHAEKLYGAAPEGDEATDASREVPDPGESSSYTFLRGTIPAVALCGPHLGKRMRVTDGTSSISGVLTGVQHGVNLIADSTLFGPETYHIGRAWVQVTFGQSGARLSPGASVELLD